MRNILRADLYRLSKSPVFRIIVLGLAFFFIIPALKDTITITVEDFLSAVPLIFGFILPAFTGLFIGTEYSDGVIRNKLTVGRTRAQVYFSMTFTVIISSLILALIWILFGAAAVRERLFDRGTEWFFVTLGLDLLIILAHSVFFSLIGLLISQKAGGTVFAIAAGILITFLCSSVYNRILEPESMAYLVIVNGEMQPSAPEPNPLYIAEPLRSRLIAALNIIPQAQAIILSNDPSEGLVRPVVMLIADLLEIPLISVFGYLLFRRKNIK